MERKWRALAEELGYPARLSVHELPFDNAAFFRSSNIKQSETGRSPYLQNLIRIQRDHVWPSNPMIQKAATGCKAIVANSFATYLVCHLAKNLQLPAFLVHLQPLLPNQVFPSYRLSEEAFVEAIVNYFNAGSDTGTAFHPEFQFEVNPDLYLALLEDGIMWVRGTTTTV